MKPRPRFGTTHHLRGAFFAVAAVGWMGCGASYQALYEGEVRFEHCHRLDAERGIGLEHRRACWREWSDSYTFGQTRDRLEYALRRQRELTAQIDNPSGTVSEAPTHNEQGTIAEPSPTNPFVPPPMVHDRSTGALQQPAAQSCVTGCLNRLSLCNQTCDPTAAPDCQRSCTAAFNACGQQCFGKP